MRTRLLIIILFVLSIAYMDLSAYRDLKNQDHAVMINAQATGGTEPQLMLSWAPNDSQIKYEIYRKKATDIAFPTTAIANVDSGIYSYIDKSVVIGERYTYKIAALGKAIYNYGNNNPKNYYGFGYVEGGIEAREYEMGKVLLLVDSTVYEPLYAQVSRLISDMENEGWAVVLRLVTRAEQFNGAKVKKVKKVIADEWAKDKKITTVFLFGRVPVPYSGISNTDGHPEHVGAWPADMYYGEMDNTGWTDFNVKTSSADRPENRNVPNDGKFDLDALGSFNTELGVGRVDLYNMQAFHKSGWENPEIELLRAYLNKDHSYRIGGKKDFPKRGIVMDNFKTMLEGFASSGWRNIASLCGNENVTGIDEYQYIQTLVEGKYLMAYGTGGGSYQSCNGVGVTTDFVGKNINAIFTFMFGSYFGDWDNSNNILRAALCSDSSALTSCWDGRPHWYFHEMGMGKPIGKSVTTSQNNDSDEGRIYYANLFNNPNNGSWGTEDNGLAGRQMCLLGDPTLRMDSYLTCSIQNLSAVQNSKNSVQLKWDAALTENVYHYNVYMRYGTEDSWTKVNTQPLTTNEMIVDVAKEGRIYFQVRTAELLTSNTGTYYAHGKAAKVDIMYSSSVSDDALFSINSYPNPAETESTISLNLLSASTINVEVFNQSGIRVKTLFNGSVSAGQQEFIWNLTNSENSRVAAGVYFVRVHSADGSLTDKIVVR
ncbi:MAG: T9SS type A sorting domain-containing protein [bacterium]